MFLEFHFNAGTQPVLFRGSGFLIRTPCVPGRKSNMHSVRQWQNIRRNPTPAIASRLMTERFPGSVSSKSPRRSSAQGKTAQSVPLPRQTTRRTPTLERKMLFLRELTILAAGAKPAKWIKDAAIPGSREH
jgi:hypothetical protein